MDKDDIIKMAQEAGFATSWTEADGEALERFAALVAAHEREACANLLLNAADHRLQSWTATLLITFSAAIRARGEQ